MVNRFVLNEVSYFGPGAREVLPKETSRLGLKKAFVATDKDLIKFGVADKVLSVLRNANIPYEVFSEINLILRFLTLRLVLQHMQLQVLISLLPLVAVRQWTQPRLLVS